MAKFLAYLALVIGAVILLGFVLKLVFGVLGFIFGNFIAVILGIIVGYWYRGKSDSGAAA